MGKEVKKHGYSCKLVRVVDGDTCDAMIDLGFNVWVKNRIRFMGVDAWESRTRNKEEKVKGLAAKAYVKDLLENSDDADLINFMKSKLNYSSFLRTKKASNLIKQTMEASGEEFEKLLLKIKDLL